MAKLSRRMNVSVVAVSYAVQRGEQKPVPFGSRNIEFAGSGKDTLRAKRVADSSTQIPKERQRKRTNMNGVHPLVPTRFP